MEMGTFFPHSAHQYPHHKGFLRSKSRPAAKAADKPGDEKEESGGLLIKRALTADELDSVFRLRYQVYCLERGYECQEDYPDGRETDEYDQYSLHFIACSGTKPVGTVRLILPNPLAFPIEKHCGVDIASISRGDTRVAEISRLAVSSEALKEGAISKSMVTIGLIRELFHANRLHGLGIRHVFAVMSGGLERRLKRCGIRFMPAGKPVHYHGARTPFYTSPDEVLKMFLFAG